MTRSKETRICENGRRRIFFHIKTGSIQPLRLRALRLMQLSMGGNKKGKLGPQEMVPLVRK